MRTLALRLLGALALTALCLLVGLLALAWLLVAFAAGSPRGWALALAFDRLGNTMAGGGHPDAYFSSRCWRYRAEAPYCWLQPAIDRVAAWLGDPMHCESSYLNEQQQRRAGAAEE